MSVYFELQSRPCVYCLDESPASLARARLFWTRVLIVSRARVVCSLVRLLSEPGPASTMVGNIIMGTRIGGASGREVADIEEDSDMARKVSERHLAQGIKILLLFPSQFCEKKNTFHFP